MAASWKYESEKHRLIDSRNSSAEAMSTEQRPFAEVNGKSIYFDEDWDTGIGGGLWSTGAAMAKYFESHASSVRRNLRRLKNGGDLRAVELGSGNGYLSVCLAAVADGLISSLALTDLEDHLPLMRKTIGSNPHLFLGITNVFVSEHKWGEFDNENDEVANEKVDFIFGSDVAYRDHLHAPLIASLKRLSHENTISFLGVTMLDTKPSFFEALSEAGFRYERLADHLMEPEFRGTTFGLFVIQPV